VNTVHPIAPNAEPKKRSRFLSWPGAIAAVLALLGILDTIYSPGGGSMPPPIFMLWALITLPLLLLALLAIPVLLCFKSWRVAVSLAAAIAVLLCGIELNATYGNQLRWHMRRAEYLAQLQSAVPAPGSNIRSIPWDGGLGWYVLLEYHDSQPAEPQSTASAHGGGASCKQTFTQLEPHYFLNKMDC
jgi:hypothetical protein